MVAENSTMPVPTTAEVREAYQGSGEGHDFKRVFHAQGRAFDTWLAEVAEHPGVERVRALHVKEYPTTADEVWKRNERCGGCRQAWPCETIEALDGPGTPDGGK